MRTDKSKISKFILSAIGPRVVGGTYLCGYWGSEYTVLEIKTDVQVWGWSITVRWADGRTTTHSTAWDMRRDNVVTKVIA